MSTHTVSQRTFALGGCSVTLVSGGALRLDGGAMFGIIPRPLWERRTAPDPQHRIRLACNCLALRENDRVTLIETGHGPKYSEKECGLYGIDPLDWLLPNLRDAQIDEQSVTDVVLTHLHFDHAGGLTHVDGGRAVRTFPRARVHVQKQEFQDARSNFGIMHATYREENYAAIDQADAWSLHSGETTIAERIRLLPTPGHTRGHQSVLVTGRDRSALFLGDVMPTAAHIGAAWNMGYDLLPLDNRESKRKLLRQAADKGWLVVLDHEPEHPVVTVREKDGWFELKPVQA